MEEKEKNVLFIDAIDIDGERFTENEELILKLSKLDESQPVNVSFRQVVKNELFSDEFTLASRLRGHKNSIELKENKELVLWLYATKLHLELAKWFIGKEFPKKTLRENYIPFPELDENSGLSKKTGLVLREPMINPETNEILLYPYHYYDEEGVMLQEKNVPIIRVITIEDGTYSPTRKPSIKERMSGFQGDKRDENNHLTSEYIEFINNIYKSSLIKNQDHLEEIVLN